MEDVFREVKVEKVSDKIVHQMMQRISEGRLQPGDKLPGERQLTLMFGVGRSSLREALNTLETMGFIEIRKRQGIFVKNIQSTIPLDPLRRLLQEDKSKIMQLYEIGRSIEQSSAAEAAEFRTEQELAGISRCLENFRDSDPGSGFTFTWDRDLAFHLAIAKASHNFLRLHIVQSIFDFSKEFIMPVIEDMVAYEDRAETLYGQHRAIYLAIKEQDRDLARETMRKHLKWSSTKLGEHFDRVVS